MALRRARLTIQDMTWEKCVSRVESTLKSLNGVLDVTAKLLEKNLGEAQILYDSAEILPDAFKQAIPAASGEKHKFTVVSFLVEV